MTFLRPNDTKSQMANQAKAPTSVLSPPSSQSLITRSGSQFLSSRYEWALLIIIAITAFIPRLMLAFQLDIYTDEPIYMIAANWYILLSKQFYLTNSHWQYNNEHPALAKYLIGISMQVFQTLHIPTASQLFPARIPSVLLGTLLVVGLYALGRAPFGRTVALLAALSLAFSSWVVYFSSLALLDTTMTALITLAYLLLYHAIHRPRLYLLCGIATGLAGASKYPAALVVPGMFLFIIYYYTLLRRELPAEESPALPWKWWIGGLCLIPISFFLADPPIWLDPIHLLLKSLAFSLEHADSGHVTFWAGQIVTHVPPWMVFFVLFAKVTAFITIPAAFFLLFAALYLVRFHWFGRQKTTSTHSHKAVETTASLAFLFIWLGSTLILFGQLNILVGTHYYLPVAPALFLGGAFGLSIIVRKLLNLVWSTPALSTSSIPSVATPTPIARFSWRTTLTFTILALALVGPHLIGLITIPDAEGYTSEFFHGENSSLEVLYVGYSDANRWLIAHSKTGGKVGIVGGSATTLWYTSNPRQEGNFRFVVIEYGAKDFPFDYLVWPMNLIQRGWGPPAAWQGHIVHTIQGGSTIYCYILARDPSSLKS